MPSWLRSSTATDLGLEPTSKARGARKPLWTRGVSSANRASATSPMPTRPPLVCLDVYHNMGWVSILGGRDKGPSINYGSQHGALGLRVSVAMFGEKPG